MKLIHVRNLTGVDAAGRAYCAMIMDDIRKAISIFIVLISASVPTWGQETATTPPKPSSHSVNVRLNPVDLIMGGAAGVDVGLSERFSLGLEYIKRFTSIGFFGRVSEDGSAIGLSLKYSFKPKFTSSWFLSAGVFRGDLTRTESSFSFIGSRLPDEVTTTRGNVGRVSAGYGWFFDNFNMSLGAAAFVGDEGLKALILPIDFSLGWAF